jgi:hypothetical protein
MKPAKLLVILLGAFLFSCAPEDAAPEKPIDEEFDTSTATLIKTGTIIGVGHTASGVASIYRSGGVNVVVLDPYESQNGPDLKVYLSKDENASQYVNLGQLKSTMGRQAYSIPATVNIDEYPFVLVWCEKFTVLFAQAELE